MDPMIILMLICNLYEQLTNTQRENIALREELQKINTESASE